MALVVTDPFGIPAPDGHTYFKVLGPPRGLANGYRMLLEAERNYRRAAAQTQDRNLRRFNLNRANILGDAATRMRQQLEALANTGAVRADEVIRSNIARTMVRPGTNSKDKRSHMADNILSRPIRTTLPSGSFGIADISELDKTRRAGTEPYWRAQEFGTDAHVGRIVPGYFQPGNSRPSAAQFRAHPAFEAVLYTRGTPAMRIQRPIQERSFLRDGVAAIATWRVRELERIEADALRAIARASGHGPAAARKMIPKPRSLDPRVRRR